MLHWLLFLFPLYLTDATLLKEEVIRCRIETSLGNIVIELYPDKAPITVANFLAYTDQHLYDNSSFFRVCTPANEADREIKIEVIQGGEVAEEKCLPPIPLETTAQTSLSHLNGTVSMARDAPHTATSSFFICIGNQPELDYGGKRNPDGQGFAAFGQVTEGMEVVRTIQQQKDNEQYLIEPVKILKIRRIEP